MLSPAIPTTPIQMPCDAGNQCQACPSGLLEGREQLSIAGTISCPLSGTGPACSNVLRGCNKKINDSVFPHQAHHTDAA